MTMKKLLAGASALAFAVSFGGIASAQSIEEGPSVLQRVLGNIDTINDGAGAVVGGLLIGNVSGTNSLVDSALVNLAATSLSVFDADPAAAGGTVADVLGNIDASVTVLFSDAVTVSGNGLLTSSITPQLNAAGDAAIANGDVITETFQELTGTLGDITTLSLGASLDATASIAAGVNQDVSEALANNSTLGVSQRVDLPELLALNGAINSASLDSTVSLTVADYSLDASAISTTAIGAVGGGSIAVGDTIGRLERSIAGVIGQ